MIELHIPEGINYECTGCGKCCGGWAVPMTQEDYERISDGDWTSMHEVYGQKELFRQLKKQESKGTPYTHKIISDTGICPFLVNNLCHMHSKYGSEFKPSICQLFPYCFSETPTGVYATVSYVSQGAIYNSGKPLAEQRQLLETKWAEFQKLYPDYKPDWSAIKLTVGQELSWQQYLELEGPILQILRDASMPLADRMRKASDLLLSRVQRAGNAASAHDTASGAAALKPLDLSLLITFHKMYYPVKTLKRGEGDFGVGRLVRQHFLGGHRLAAPKESFSVEELKEIEWPQDQEINNILDRYFYSYVFGKKYFGAGFGQVSVIAGFHHLILMLALIRLQSKISARLRKASVVNVLDVAATVRQMERQVGESKLSGSSAAVWELLLFSPGRARRFLANC